MRTARGLFSSWATPASRDPMVASFSLCRNFWVRSSTICTSDPVLALELEVEASNIEEVLDAEEDFQAVEGLGQEVPGAGGERALPRLGPRVGGQHHPGEVAVPRDRTLPPHGHARAMRHH